MQIDDGPAGQARATLDDDRAYSAIVVPTPQGRTGVWVTIPDEPELEGAAHGPCLYQPVPGSTPAVGDRCLVARANGRDEWWIVQFDNTADAIDARLDVLEALGLTKRRRGTVDVSTVAAVSGSATVAHGLGATPAVVNATAQNSTNGLTNVTVSNIGATTFDVGIRFVDGVTRTSTINVGWEAIA